MKCVNPKAIEIQRRFFEALEMAIEAGKITGIQGFCKDHNFNRPKYSRLRNNEDGQYKAIDIDALAAICTDFGVSAEWLLLGRGKMLKRDNNAHSEKHKIPASQKEKPKTDDISH